MSKKRYLVLMRSAPAATHSRPSPEQLQQMFAAYSAWMQQFKDELVDLGDKLKPDGRVVRASGVSDGPFVETKEVVGGFMIVAAESYERAVEIVKACPASQAPGAALEVRELVGAKM